MLFLGGYYSWYKKDQSFIGHVGITEIESADELARKGAERAPANHRGHTITREAW